MSQTGCQCDPALKAEWGCESPAQCAVWRDLEGNDYYVCPLRYIPQSVLGWYEEYAYCKEFGESPGLYHCIPSKWHESLHYYKHELDAYTEANKPKTDKTAALKAGLRGRNG